jgi:peptide deformylase
MALLPIYTYGTPVLRKKAASLRRVDNSVVELIMNMFETMRKAGGIGLAATQVGELHRVITIDLSEMEDHHDQKPLVLINPTIVAGDGNWKMEEGCLSIPDVRDEVERAEHIRIRYKDTNFKDVELEADRMLTRVILHEIDHLNGVLFVDHLSPERLKAHEEELKKIERGEMEVDYPVVAASLPTS